ncbi:Gamma-secretase subunit pen-2 [Kappamyces sp. JEL0680]|nr:Gamma-secretase subunit pen-2 [Kappamyces sp. JEL0680]
MNIHKMPAAEVLQLSRKYFYIGFAFLPFFWLVNYVWIGRFVRSLPPELEDAYRDVKTAVQRYTLYSLMGSLLWVGILVAWLAGFLVNRTAAPSSWSDSLLVYLPKG